MRGSTVSDLHVSPMTPFVGQVAIQEGEPRRPRQELLNVAGRRGFFCKSEEGGREGGNEPTGRGKEERIRIHTGTLASEYLGYIFFA